jgi:tRNA(His) 5'-end guanylyltransferase
MDYLSRGKIQESSFISTTSNSFPEWTGYTLDSRAVEARKRRAQEYLMQRHVDLSEEQAAEESDFLMKLLTNNE